MNRLSIGSRKTKTKVVAPTNHNRRRQFVKLHVIRTQSNAGSQRQLTGNVTISFGFTSDNNNYKISPK